MARLVVRARCLPGSSPEWSEGPAGLPALGHPVVKLLVEQSGGTLTKDSGDGQGAAFAAILPRYDGDAFPI